MAGSSASARSKRRATSPAAPAAQNGVRAPSPPQGGMGCPRRFRSKAAAAAETAPDPDQWTKENQAHVFATDVQAPELRDGYTSFSFPWHFVGMALVAYGMYLLYKGAGMEEIKTSVYLSYDSAANFVTGHGNTPSVIMLMIVAVVVTTAVIARRPRNVYLVDFDVFECPPSWRCNQERFNRQNSLTGGFTDESMNFMNRILKSSTLEDTTCFPPAVMADEINLNMAAAREEASLVLCGAVEKVLKKTGIDAKSIDAVVVNCSLFSPTPSLSSIIVNKFRMRTDVLNYSLGGMGCSAGLISVDVAQRVLQTRPNTRVLVVSTECMTENWYHGNERAYLITNCIFRVGASALILSNRRSDRKRATFQLSHLVRTHMGADDEAYDSVFQDQDKDGKQGVRLSRKIMVVAGDALRSNMTRLGPKVLPVIEQAKFLLNLVGRKMTTGSLPLPRPLRRALQTAWLLGLRTPVVGATMRAVCHLPKNAGRPLPPKDGAEPGAKPRLDIGKPYVPIFRKAFDVCCVHAGGRAVLDAIEKNLALTKRDMEPSRATLARYGNTSSSSIWYELEYARRHMGMRAGDRVWQIAFGSGFMCNSAVWKTLRTPKPSDFDMESNHATRWKYPEVVAVQK